VDQVVGALDVARGAREAGGVGDVADVQLVSRPLELGGLGAVPGQTANALPSVAQGAGEAAADEAGGTGD
jgi:hypothetical protein